MLYGQPDVAPHVACAGSGRRTGLPQEDRSLAVVAAKGTAATTANYNLADDKPFSDISFYRLKIVDKDTGEREERNPDDPFNKIEITQIDSDKNKTGENQINASNQIHIY